MKNPASMNGEALAVREGESFYGQPGLIASMTGPQAQIAKELDEI
jgi:hypothetical protein